jgi:hypothetical protein
VSFRRSILSFRPAIAGSQQWIRSGKLEAALKLLARHLYERGKLNLDEAFVDATFASAKKGASPSPPSRQRHQDRRYRCW